MAVGYFSSADTNTSENEKARRLRINRHCSEVPSPVDQPNVATKYERGIRNSDMAPVLGLCEPTARRGDTKKLEYLQHYALDMAYIAPPWQEETPRTFKRRVYSTLQMLAMAGRGT
jgi:hypothetical protein